MLTVGEAMQVERQGVYGNSLHFLLSCAVNPKLLLNIKFINMERYGTNEFMIHC